MPERCDCWWNMDTDEFTACCPEHEVEHLADLVDMGRLTLSQAAEKAQSILQEREQERARVAQEEADRG